MTSHGRLLLVVGAVLLVCTPMRTSRATASTSGRIADPPAATEVLDNVFMVKSLNCASQPTSRILTGFRVAAKPGLPAGIITALHGVAGCPIQSAVDRHGWIVRNLHPRLTSIGADIVLLVSSELDAGGTSGLELAPVTDWRSLGAIRVAGHPFGQLGVDSRSAELTDPPLESIGNMAVGGTLAWLALRASPDTQLKAVSLTGAIAPGHSGGPVLLNAQDVTKARVIAMIDGGQPGPGGKAWAIVTAGITWTEYPDHLPQRLVVPPDDKILYFFPTNDTSDPIRVVANRGPVSATPDTTLHATKKSVIDQSENTIQTDVALTRTGVVSARVTVSTSSAFKGFCGTSAALFYDAQDNLLQTMAGGSQWCVDGRYVPFTSPSERTEAFGGLLDPAIRSRVAKIEIANASGSKNVLGDFIKNRQRKQ